MAVTRQNKKLPVSNKSIDPREILAVQADQALARLNTATSGLNSEEAESRLEIYGTNEVARKGKRPAFVEFLNHFRNPVTIILIIAAVISAIVGDDINMIIILVIVLISVLLDFTQEYRAGKAAEALAKRVATTATILRDGTKQEINVAVLVPGDIVNVSAGDVVPADARVIFAKDFFVDQATLTGESYPVEKTATPLAAADIEDSTKWNNYLFMGTSVTNGTASAVITRTGDATQFGEIARKTTEKKPETEFESGLRRFGYLIMQVTFVLVIAVFVINTEFKHTRLIDALLFSVALAVGLTPGLLPMILSINLARGASSMSKKGVIVKRLASIQNFGSMDVLCADKTGTLTENRVTMILHVDLDGQENEKVFTYSLLNSRYQTGLKNQLDEAIIRFKDVNTDQYKRIDEIPFDFVRKRLSVVVEETGNTYLITKGAPEEVAGIISKYEAGAKVRDIIPDIKSRIERKYRELSNQGFRVLSVCYRLMEPGKTTFTIPDEKEMVFLGFIAFLDPLKATTKESLNMLRKAGVKLKVLTGDNEIVAARICHELDFRTFQYSRGIKYDEATGLINRTLETTQVNIVTSREIQDMNDDALARVVEKADIFTRVNPAQKNRIINALKANGHVVGYIGDGINDTPSMKVADVSISVMNAVDIAKESADIILLQNDLKVISDGVIEGRKTFGNTMKYIMMAMSSNFGNMFSAAGASLFLKFLPMLPIQILLNNLLYSFAQLMLPADNVDASYVQQPRRMQTSFVRNFMLTFGPVSSIFDFLTFAVLIFYFHAGESLFQTAWFVESLFTQTLVIFVIRTSYSPFFKSRPGRLLVINILVVLALSIILPYTPVGTFFKFVPLPANFLGILLVFIIIYLGLAELMKKWFFRRERFVAV